MKLVPELTMTRRAKENLAVRTVLLGLAMGVVMVVLSMFSVSASPPSPAPALPANAVPTDRNSIGHPNAKVQVVVYFDFQCSHCMQLYFNVENQIIQRYVSTDKVRLETRPLNFLGPASLKGATALMAAADQGHYWDYQAALWDAVRLRGPGALTDENLKALAIKVGMNRALFDAAYASPAKATEVTAFNKTFEDHAKAQGVKASVPQTLINGRLIVGEAPLEQFVTVIEEELAK